MAVTERFSTAGIIPSERLAFWNRIANETYSEHVVEPRSADFGATLQRRSYGDLCVTHVATTPAVLHGKMPDSPSREREHTFLALQDAGASDQSGHHQPTRLTEGTMALNMLSFTGTVSFDEPTRFIILKLPTTRLAARVSNLDRLQGVRVEARDAALLATFLRTLVARDMPAIEPDGNEPGGDEPGGNEPGGNEPGWNDALGEVIYNLVALTYHRAGLAAAAHPAARAGSGDRWQRTVRDFVDRHLEESQLSTTMIAQRLGVTPRYIQMVFAGMATTASAYIVARRLELAAQLLRRGDGAISAVAYRTGFSDLSYFYRSFRKRFGVSPGRFAAQRR